MKKTEALLGMILKGYPRISEAFISNEIYQLEKRGISLEIYSLRKPREDFTHRWAESISAPVLYVPEYVKPYWRSFLATNGRFFLRHPLRYSLVGLQAIIRAVERQTTATLRHFLQAGYVAFLKVSGRPVVHLHAHFSHTPTSVTFFLSQLTGVPFSFTAHAKDIYTSDPAQLRRKIRRARFVVTCTEYNARYLKKIAVGLKTPIHTIYHGIDLSLFTYGHKPPEGGPYRILSVGRLVEKKGYDDVLRALAVLKNGSLTAEPFRFEFLHIGDGEEGEKIRRMAAELGLEKVVKFMGTLPHEQVIPFYRTSHLFVLGCKKAANGDQDGLPNVILEAMAVGIPVVATNFSAIPEAVVHGETGILVEPGRPEALALAIAEACGNYGLSLERAGRARKRVEEKFDQNIWIGRLHALLEQAMYEGMLLLSE